MNEALLLADLFFTNIWSNVHGMTFPSAMNKSKKADESKISDPSWMKYVSPKHQEKIRDRLEEKKLFAMRKELFNAEATKKSISAKNESGLRNLCWKPPTDNLALTNPSLQKLTARCWQNIQDWKKATAAEVKAGIKKLESISNRTDQQEKEQKTKKSKPRELLERQNLENNPSNNPNKPTNKRLWIELRIVGVVAFGIIIWLLMRKKQG